MASSLLFEMRRLDVTEVQFLSVDVVRRRGSSAGTESGTESVAIDVKSCKMWKLLHA